MRHRGYSRVDTFNPHPRRIDRYNNLAELLSQRKPRRRELLLKEAIQPDIDAEMDI